MKKILVSLFAVAFVAAFANADEVTEVMDTFTGSDGTIVAPGAMWGYTNIGLENNTWATYPRPGAQDLYCISNNQLFMYCGPIPSNPPIYQKVQAAIMPGSFADPDYITFTNGQIEFSMDVVASAANAGNMWGFTKETKPILNSAANFVDNPGENHFRFQIQVDPNDVDVADLSARIYPTSNEVTLAIGDDIPLPISLKMIVEKDGDVMVYTNGVLVVMTNVPMDMASITQIYPFIWDGEFSGAGVVKSESYLEIDNYNVKWTPEPGAFALLVLALPLLRKLG